MSVAPLCLACDGEVEEALHGNLVAGDGMLRARLEKVVGPAVHTSPRSVSLCAACHTMLSTIEEYYRQVEVFRHTFNSTLDKYGEPVMGAVSADRSETQDAVAQAVQSAVQNAVAQNAEDKMAAVPQPTWTICLQTGDGSLVPLQQGAPLVMADDHQVVLETVTVESSETPQLTQGDEAPAEGAQENFGAAESSADCPEMPHPSILDHTGMALPTETDGIDEAQAEIPPKPLFTCARCGAQFEQADDLVTHERNEGHLGGYNYKCGVCGNIYARLDSLRDHMCRHTGEKPHQCNICHEKFSFRNQLSRHRTAHYQTQVQNTTGKSAIEGSGNILAVTLANSSKSEELAATQFVGPDGSGDAETEGGDGLAKSLVSTDDVNSQLQTILHSSELQLVQTNSGEVHLVSKPFPTEPSNYTCPKCKGDFATRMLLQRHQCPSLSMQFMNEFVCPKCNASFIKRTFLERHKCPSLLYYPQPLSPSLDETEQTEVSEGQKEGATLCETDEKENLLIVSDGDVSEAPAFKAPSVTASDPGEMADDQCQNVKDKAEPDDDEVTHEKSPVAEIPKLGADTIVETPVKEGSVNTSEDESVIRVSGQDAGVAERIPSVFRRSSRAAGKVNPILEMMKKKRRNQSSESPAGDRSGDINVKSITENSESEGGVNEDLAEPSVVKRKRGRPPKAKTTETPSPPAKRKRGRPPKKRGRGRPRKYPRPTSPDVSEVDEEKKAEEKVNNSHERVGENGTPTPVKRRPGRPRKIRVPDEEVPETNGGDVKLADESGPGKEPEGSNEVKATESVASSENKGNSGEGNHEEEADNSSTRPVRSARTKITKEKADYVSAPDDSESEEDAIDEDDSKEYTVPRKEKSVETRRDFQKTRTEFKCEKCDRYFSTLIALEKHKTTRIHRRGLNTGENRKFTCKVCGRGFMKIEHLRDHGVNHTAELKHECIVCKKKFKFRSQLALHRNRAHSSSAVAEAMNRFPHYSPRGRYRNSHRPPGDEEFDPKYQPEVIDALDGDVKGSIYRCKICMQIFTEMRLFNRHIISHFSIKPFKCDICSKEFTRADTLRTHKKIHYYGFEQTESGAFLCDTCGRQFRKAETLRNHVKMHFGQRSWKCEVCGKGFVDKYTLSRHVVIHQTQKPWLCATCGRGFNRRSHLEAHEAQHTGKNLFKCEICDRGFSDQGNLGRHMLVHSDARPWACTVCGDTFKRKGNLDEHALTHNTERHAICDVCGAQFTTKRYLRIHQLIHTGDRPHKCSICSAAFRQLSALITHKRIHTGDAPYKCLHCDRRFKYYDQWKAHEYGHTDAKPYKCMLCTATYRQAGSLRQHRKVAHGSQRGMVFLCTMCNKTFASTMSLERHMKKVHDVEATLQAIGQEAIPTTSSSETSNIVQITNPQGTIEAVELTNLPEDCSNRANIVQLLDPQTLANLQSGQMTMATGGTVQLTDGQRIVQLVTGLDDNAQVLEVASGESQVISIDNIANITSQGAVVSEADGVLQYDPNVQPTVMQIADGQAYVSTVTEMEHVESETTQSIAEALTSVTQPAGRVDDQQMHEVQTLTVNPETNTLSCVVSIPQDLSQITSDPQSASLVPIEIVPVETTVTTLETTEHANLVTIETQQLDAGEEGAMGEGHQEVLQTQQDDVIHGGGDDVMHTREGDVITETVTHELHEQEVVETVSIATTYVPNV